MERNLKAFRNGEPKMANFEGHDSRLISNPALCEIFNVLLNECFRRNASATISSVREVEDVLSEICVILSARVHDCFEAEFFSGGAGHE